MYAYTFDVRYPNTSGVYSWQLTHQVLVVDQEDLPIPQLCGTLPYQIRLMHSPKVLADVGNTYMS